jgi:pimeloyl-ACP methyl ester carboxylesterase
LGQPASTLRRLLLLPGLLCDAELWRDQIVGLSDVAMCTVPDFSTGCTIAELADTAMADVEAPVAVAGFSLGGYVAQEILRRWPQAVTHLALIDTGVRSDTPERAAQRQRLIEGARTGAFRGLTERLLSTYVDPSRLDDRLLVDRIQAMTQRLGREVFIRQSSMERPDGERILRQFSGPVLVACGSNDRITPAEDHRQMAAMARRAELVVIDDCGHMAPLERPDIVTCALRDWLERG